MRVNDEGEFGLRLRRKTTKAKSLEEVGRLDGRWRRQGKWIKGVPLKYRNKKQNNERKVKSSKLTTGVRSSEASGRCDGGCSGCCGCHTVQPVKGSEIGSIGVRTTIGGDVVVARSTGGIMVMMMVVMMTTATAATVIVATFSFLSPIISPSAAAADHWIVRHQDDSVDRRGEEFFDLLPGLMSSS